MIQYLNILAQTSETDASDAAGAFGAMGMVCCFWIFYILLIIGSYVYYSMALMTIAKKLGATEKAWWAWIPILNVLLMLELSQQPTWWIVLFMIPFVNIVISVMVWMAIAEARGKPSWWGIMFLVPVMNIIAPGYIAWSE